MPGTGSRIRYVWPLRVPIISGAILVALPWVTFETSMRSFLSGLFDPVDVRGLLVITTLAVFNAWTATIIASLVLSYGSARFDLPPLSLRCFPVKPAVWLLGLILAAPVVGTTIWYTVSASKQSSGAAGEWAAAGVVLAAVMLAGALRVSAELARRDRTYHRRARASWPGQLYGQLLAWLARHPAFGAGFVITGDDGRCELAPGHGIAVGLAAASIVLYLGTAGATHNLERPVFGSALGYLLLQMLMLTWLLGVVAFLFDRGRLPLALLLIAATVIVIAVTHTWFTSDHIYRTVPARADAPTLLPADALLPEDEPSIVVAASGGGIEAAAWTTEVLTSLQTMTGFQEHLRLVSAVSGGSVGTMYAMAALPNCGPPAAPASGLAFDPNDGRARIQSSCRRVGVGVRGSPEKHRAVLFESLRGPRLVARRRVEARGATAGALSHQHGAVSGVVAPERGRARVPGRRVQRHGRRNR